MFEGAHLGGCRFGGPQILDRIAQANAKPGVEAFAQAVNLAIGWRGGQRHGIQIIDDDALAPGAGVGAGLIGFQTGADDLAQFLQGIAGAAVRRMAKFFQLDCQCTAALKRYRQLEYGPEIIKPRFERPVPLYHRILPRRYRPVQVAVLQEQKGLDQERRDVVDLAEEKLALGVAEKLHAVGAADFQAGIRPFQIGRRDAALQKREHGFRLAHLFGHPIALGFQAGLKGGQLGVAAPLVEGRGTGENDLPARPVF